MRPGSALSVRGGRGLALAAIVLVSLNMRTAVAGVSPIAGRIGEDIPLSAAALGAVGMMPPIAFALFGLIAPLLAKRFGLEAAVVIALGAILAGLLLRSVSPGLPTFLVTSLLTLAGMGIGNVILPPLVKRYFPQRIGLVSGVTGLMFSLSTAFPSLLAAPLADQFGWRVSLGSWALLAVAALAPWLILAVQRRPGPTPDPVPELIEPTPEVVGRVWHSGISWSLALIFGAAASNAYALFAWLPQILVETAGTTETTSGSLLALYGAMGLVINLVVPGLVVRLRNASVLVYVGVGLFLGGYTWMLVGPAVAPWAWVALLGLGPMLFTICLVMFGTRTRTEQGSVGLSAFVQCVGYALGALGPIIVGLLRELTGGWLAPVGFLVLTLLAAAFAAGILAKPRMLEDHWHKYRR